MTKYKVTATRGVGYTSIIDANSQDEALKVARGWGYTQALWHQTHDGHDWSIESILEVKDD